MSQRRQPSGVDKLPGPRQVRGAEGSGLTDLVGAGEAPADSLYQRLVFDQAGAAVRLDGFRMMLMYSTLLARLKHELMAQSSYQHARGAVERLGYAEGTKIALLASERGQDNSFEAVMGVARPVWALTGNAHVRVVSAAVDPAAGVFDVELELTHSVEAQAHLEAFGSGGKPMCWLQTGAANGLCSAFSGRAILFREIECVAMGYARCRLLGKPVETWGDAAEELGIHLRPDELVNRFSLARGQAAAWLETLSDDVVGVSASFVAALEELRKVAPTRATVLLQGETGTGKEVFAKLLHRMSGRESAPFVAVNCAALPDSLVEAELFGVERGAYTGASQPRPGRFERAEAGTLFLDEIGSLSLATQVKLLRVLQEGEVERLGAVTTRSVDVRVVAACNEDLRRRVAAGTFREDLYFRLAVFPVSIPPLRERREDIPLLIEHFMRRYQYLHHRRVSGLSGRAARVLLQYSYPGNVRELEHVIERAVIRAEDDQAIDLQHLDLAVQHNDYSFLEMDGKGTLHAECTEPTELGTAADMWIGKGLSLALVETTLLERALERSEGNRSQAARMLGLSRRQFNYRLQSIRRSRTEPTSAAR